jgi:hypothetical protein
MLELLTRIESLFDQLQQERDIYESAAAKALAERDDRPTWPKVREMLIRMGEAFWGYGTDPSTVGGAVAQREIPVAADAIIRKAREAKQEQGNERG